MNLLQLNLMKAIVGCQEHVFVKVNCTEEEAKKVGEQHQNAKVIHN